MFSFKSGGSAKGMTPDLIHRYLTGDPLAKEILNGWRFQSNRSTIIRTVSAEQYQDMLARQGIEDD